MESTTIEEHQPLLSTSSIPLDSRDLTLPWYRRPNYWWIIVPFSFLAITWGGALSPTYSLIGEIACEYIETAGINEVVDCQSPDVSALEAKLITRVIAISSILAIITTSFYANLSDRRGRRMVFLVIGVSTILSPLLMIIASKYHHYTGIWPVYAAVMCEGLGGASTTLLATAHAYLTDCTQPAERSIIFARFMGVSFLGQALGPTLFGTIAEAAGSVTPVFVIIAIVNFIWILVALIMPESNRNINLSPKNDEPNQSFLSRFNVFSIFDVLFTPSTITTSRWTLPLLVVVHMMAYLAVVGIAGIMLVYTQFVFKWGILENGVLLSVQNISKLLVLVLILPAIKSLLTNFLIPKPSPSNLENLPSPSISITDIKTNLSLMMMGLSLDGVAFILCGLVPGTRSKLFYGTIALTGLGSLYSPSYRVVMTMLSPAHRVGAILGVLSVIEALGTTLSIIIFQHIYSASVYSFPAIVWFLAAFWISCAFSLAGIIRFRIGGGNDKGIIC